MPTTPAQSPLGSGFDATSTASEVLAGRDLSGRTALVTGGYAGIGLEITRALVAAGARVLAPARRPQKAAEVLADLPLVEVGAMDLGDQASVAAYVDGLLADGRPVDVVIDNAGIMALPETRTTAGWELQLATNHLGHFALVNRLWPLLGAGSRVVSVSSSGHQHSAMRWDDPWFTTGYDKWLAYGQSKTANILFGLGLDARGRESGVRAWSLHPGAILTNLGKHLTDADIAALLEPDDDGQVAIPHFKSAAQGAATAAWAATSDVLLEHGGAFLEDCDLAPWADEALLAGREGGGVRRYALDPHESDRLWEWSAALTGVDAFA